MPRTSTATSTSTGHTLPIVEGTIVGDADAFVRSYDRDGTLRWERHIGSNNRDYGQAVATDRSGALYVAGRTDGALEGPNAGEDDDFVRSYGADGEIHVTGSTNGSLEGTQACNHAAFPRVFGTDGALSWTRRSGTGGYDLGRAVVADDHGGACVAGHVHGDLEGPSSGGTDAFIRKNAK